MATPNFPCGLKFSGKPRRHFMAYTIVSRQFSTEEWTTFYCYAVTGEISVVAGASCFRVSRAQLDYALRQARENGYEIRRRTELPTPGEYRTQTWNAPK